MRKGVNCDVALARLCGQFSTAKLANRTPHKFKPRERAGNVILLLMLNERMGTS